jgi:hypothetical protein
VHGLSGTRVRVERILSVPFAPHLRLSAIGHLGDPGAGEDFVFTISIGTPQGIPALPASGWDGYASDCANDLRAFFKQATTHVSGRAVLREAKLAFIGADGRYTRDPYLVPIADGAGAGSDQGQTLPQAALAVSLVTERRGPSGKGRFYLPMPVLPIGFSLLADQAQCQEVAVNAAQLIANLGNAPGWDVDSGGVVVASTKGFNTPVTGVRVGRVVDTIRTRRRSLSESYGPVVDLP